MVEVFITNVQSEEKANSILHELEVLFPDYVVNFDLEDHDKILRVESKNINTEHVIEMLNKKNINCEILK